MSFQLLLLSLACVIQQLEAQREGSPSSAYRGDHNPSSETYDADYYPQDLDTIKLYLQYRYPSEVTQTYSDPMPSYPESSRETHQYSRLHTPFYSEYLSPSSLYLRSSNSIPSYYDPNDFKSPVLEPWDPIPIYQWLHASLHDMYNPTPLPIVRNWFFTPRIQSTSIGYPSILTLPIFQSKEEIFPSKINIQPVDNDYKQLVGIKDSKSPSSKLHGAEKTPHGAEKIPHRADKTPYEAEKTAYEAENTPNEAEKTPYGAEKTPYEAEKTPHGSEKTTPSNEGERPKARPLQFNIFKVTSNEFSNVPPKVQHVPNIIRIVPPSSLPVAFRSNLPKTSQGTSQ